MWGSDFRPTPHPPKAAPLDTSHVALGFYAARPFRLRKGKWLLFNEIESSADCDFPHRASPLVSPKPAENRRLPPQKKWPDSVRFGIASLLCASQPRPTFARPLVACASFRSATPNPADTGSNVN